MATYAELRIASENPTLMVKVQVACVIAANTISAELATLPLHAQRMAWAKSVYLDPDATARRMMWAVLAKNASATPAQIAGATDAQIQTNVDAAVDVFATVAGP